MLITSMSAKGLAEYGHRLINGARRFMPDEERIIYSEDDLDLNEFVACLHFVPTFVNFLHRHDGDDEVAGRKPRPGWKGGDETKGYCFKFDAMKFCRKVFCIADAARHLGHGSLTWIDADAYPTQQVPVGFFDRLSGADVTFLGREGTHSECGFLHFRLPAAMPLIQAWEAFYATDSFLKEREWHDSYLFDLARAASPEVKCRSISERGARGHVWVTSPLGRYFDHTKGDRKRIGYSPERIARGL